MAISCYSVYVCTSNQFTSPAAATTPRIEENVARKSRAAKSENMLGHRVK